MKYIKTPAFLNKRLGFFSLLVVLLWLKTIFAYLVDFHLGIESGIQYFILFINLLQLHCYYLELLFISDAQSCLYHDDGHLFSFDIACFFECHLLSRIHGLHYDQHDFRCWESSKCLGESAIRLFRPYDVIYWIDFIILTVLLIAKKIKLDPRPIRARMAFAISTLAVMISQEIFLWRKLIVQNY